MHLGAFVEVLPGKEGLVHISQLANYRVGRVEDVVKVGDQLKVPGNLIGGVTPDNDLIVEVTQLFFDHAPPFAVFDVA